MNGSWKGILPIAPSAFDSSFAFDERSFVRVVEWMVRVGSHGIVWPGEYSEVGTLTQQERFYGTELIVQAVAGRIPVIIGVSARSLPESILYAQKARECGADGLMLMLPEDLVREYGLIKHYYRAIAEAAGLPIVLQNKGGKGTSLSVDIVRRLGVELELVQYVKEETDPEMVSSEKLLRACSGVFKGVFTGTGGAWLLWELERGIDGNMPGAPVVDVLVKIWNLWSVGRKAEALELQDRHSAFTKIWEGLPRGARKVILVKRGLITSAVLRNLGEVSLTDLDQAALDHALDILRPHLVQ